MTKSKPDTTALSDMMTQAQNLLTSNAGANPQMAGLLEAQQNFLSEAQEFSKHWYARRREALETAIEAAKNITGNLEPDPAEAISAITDWQTHSMERMTADFQEWVEICSRSTGNMVDSKAKKKS